MFDKTVSSILLTYRILIYFHFFFCEPYQIYCQKQDIRCVVVN